MSSDIWQFWVDTGGTFTDCFGIDPTGKWHQTKVLSHSALRGVLREVTGNARLQVDLPNHFCENFFAGFQLHFLEEDRSYEIVESVGRELVCRESLHPSVTGQLVELSSPEEAPLLAMRCLTGTRLRDPLPPLSLRLATTKGTNALLERKGEPTALFVTKGFKDILRIGTQKRPELFTLNVEKPKPVTEFVFEVDERLDPEGRVIQNLDFQSLKKVITFCREQSITTAAVSLLHSYLNPSHEEALKNHLEKCGFASISLSSRLAPFIGYLNRTQTTVVNATLEPIISSYLNRIEEAVGTSKIFVMSSAGSLIGSENFQAKESLLSGPAGGIVGASQVGELSGRKKIIAFDMGGTSTDVSRYEENFDFVRAFSVGDIPLVSEALAIETVAAGGGSICWFDGWRLRVGPQSAGAFPGPACYGGNGPLTLTDVNLLLGRLDPNWFKIPIDLEKSKKRLSELLLKVRKIDPDIDETSLLLGCLKIANEKMAGAIQKVSLRKGYDARDYTLVSYGGAGGQHITAVASVLNMERILIPQNSSLLSAWGLGQAKLQRTAREQILSPLQKSKEKLETSFARLKEKVVRELLNEGVAREWMEFEKIVFLRVPGTEAVIELPWAELETVKKQFAAKYHELYGISVDQDIEVDSIILRGADSRINVQEVSDVSSLNSDEIFYKRMTFEQGVLEVPCFHRPAIQENVSGPCLIHENHTVVVMEPGWQAHLDSHGTLVIEKKQKEERLVTKGATSQAIQRELFSHRFTQIAEEMGETLRATTLSTNVRERLDFSCALLDRDGTLIVNAPHIPVHLGALGICVRRVKENFDFHPGDSIVTNHPAFGGSHLPDVTVITPVFIENDCVGFVASRAHHAEIGGLAPGSMSPEATCLEEEGVVIEPMYLVKEGKENWSELRHLFSTSSYPSRNPEANLADLKAALMANRRGERLLQNLHHTYGKAVASEQMGSIKQHASWSLRKAFKSMSNGVYQAIENMDDGSRIQVKLKLEGGKMGIDFSGSSPVHPGSLNATEAVVTSAVIYFLRLLLAEELPLNEGLLENIDLKIPLSFLNPSFSGDPKRDSAVVGGNVETSQRVVDTLLKALGFAACSQGTMNNLLFGNDQFSYYETICGGTGATRDAAGESAVHSHMTNTQITDPEVLEYRYPVRLNEFSIRENSGGKGLNRGGDGVNRHLTFLEDVSVTLLSEHRQSGPFGLEGGETGALGAQCLVKKTGERIDFSGNERLSVQAGESVLIQTPGGGGFGS